MPKKAEKELKVDPAAMNKVNKLIEKMKADQQGPRKKTLRELNLDGNHIEVQNMQAEGVRRKIKDLVVKVWCGALLPPPLRAPRASPAPNR